MAVFQQPESAQTTASSSVARRLQGPPPHKSTVSCHGVCKRSLVDAMDDCHDQSQAGEDICMDRSTLLPAFLRLPGSAPQVTIANSVESA